MGSRRHINLPGVRVNLPPLTEKDLADVEVGAELGVDFVALSFCREASDIETLRTCSGNTAARLASWPRSRTSQQSAISTTSLTRRML
jgi:pyruvate kinase